MRVGAPGDLLRVECVTGSCSGPSLIVTDDANESPVVYIATRPYRYVITTELLNSATKTVLGAAD